MNISHLLRIAVPTVLCVPQPRLLHSRSTIINHYTVQLEYTQRVQTSAKYNVLFCNVKLVHSIEIRLITKVVGITVLTPSAAK